MLDLPKRIRSRDGQTRRPFYGTDDLGRGLEQCLGEMPVTQQDDTNHERSG